MYSYQPCYQQHQIDLTNYCFRYGKRSGNIGEGSDIPIPQGGDGNKTIVNEGESSFSTKPLHKGKRSRL